MSTQWPRIYDQLLVIFHGLSALEDEYSDEYTDGGIGWGNVNISDGQPFQNDSTPQFLSVGWSPDAVSAGAYSKTLHPNGFEYIETGSIVSRLVCNSTSTGLASPRALIFFLADQFEQSIRNDRTLGGVLSPDSSCDVSTEVFPVQAATGSAYGAVFTVTYLTVT